MTDFSSYFEISAVITSGDCRSNCAEVDGEETGVMAVSVTVGNRARRTGGIYCSCGVRAATDGVGNIDSGPDLVVVVKEETSSSRRSTLVEVDSRVASRFSIVAAVAAWLVDMFWIACMIPASVTVSSFGEGGAMVGGVSGGNCSGELRLAGRAGRSWERERRLYGPPDIMNLVKLLRKSTGRCKGS